MVRNDVSVLCALLLLWSSFAQAAPLNQTFAAGNPTIKQQVVEISGGSIIEVKLHNKQKLRGRMGAVTDSDFEVQSMKDGELQTTKVAFQDVKSVKTKSVGGWSTGTKVAVVVLAGLGVLALVGAILCATGGCQS
jgi:hypothetical protein